MAPTTGQQRVLDPILTEVVQGYQHPERVGFELFPRVIVRQRGGRVIKFGRESFKLYNTRRAPGAATKRLQFGYEGERFGLVQDALEGQVPREHMRDAAQVPGFDLGREAVREVMDIISLSTEVEQANLATDASNYSSSHSETLSGTDQWSSDESDPSIAIADGKETVRSAVGMYPNVIVLGAQVFAKLQHNPKILERFKYTSRESVTTEMLAQLWDVRKVAVGKAVYMDEGDNTMKDVWGRDAVMGHVPEQVGSRRTPSYGYTYTLEGHPLVEEAYWDANSKSWMYPITEEKSAELTGIERGFLIKDAVAAPA